MLIDPQLLSEILAHNGAATLPPLLAPLRQQMQERAVAALNQRSLRERWKYSRANHFLGTWDKAASNETSSIAVQQADGVSTTPMAQLPANASTAQYVQAQLANNRYWEAQPLADLVTTSGAGGLFVDASAGSCGDLELCLGAGHGFVIVRMAPDAQLNLTIRYEACDAALRHWVHVDMQANSRLNTDVVLDSQAEQRLLLVQVELAQNAAWQGQQQILASGGRQRVDTIARLRGDHAAVNLRGAAIAVNGAKVDQQVEMNHCLANANSQQRFHTATGTKATNTFNGRIHIAENAIRTDAQLNNRNLLLAPDAAVNAKPELEIYTDDVSCSHGSTIGALDETLVHYLRSRGLDANGAKKLLLRAFIQECLQGPNTGAISDRAMQLLAESS